MAEYLLIFTMGLFGALHCVGMCGGFVMACSMKCGGGMRFSLVYNLGRVFSYMLLGAVMGAAGKALAAAGALGGFQGALPVLAGAVMIIIGLDLLGLTPKFVRRFGASLIPASITGALFGNQIKRKRPAVFLLGMINGLIPCAMLYAVGVKAASTAEPVSGMLVMAALGAGTFIPMVTAGAFGSTLARLRSNVMVTASSVILIALGVKAVVFAVAPSAHHMGHLASITAFSIKALF